LPDQRACRLRVKCRSPLANRGKSPNQFGGRTLGPGADALIGTPAGAEDTAGAASCPHSHCGQISQRPGHGVAERDPDICWPGASTNGGFSEICVALSAHSTVQFTVQRNLAAQWLIKVDVIRSAP
jgi:hypothetical protein